MCCVLWALLHRLTTSHPEQVPYYGLVQCPGRRQLGLTAWGCSSTTDLAGLRLTPALGCHTSSCSHSSAHRSFEHAALTPPLFSISSLGADPTSEARMVQGRGPVVAGVPSISAGLSWILSIRPSPPLNVVATVDCPFPLSSRSYDPCRAPATQSFASSDLTCSHFQIRSSGELELSSQDELAFRQRRLTKQIQMPFLL